jgi:membrane fusion protein, multidrug efflux system
MISSVFAGRGGRSPRRRAAACTSVAATPNSSMEVLMPLSKLAPAIVRSSWPAALVVGCAAALAACSKGKEPGPAKAVAAPPLKVTTVTAAEQPTPTVLTLTGTVAADQRSEVTADTQGKVLAVMFERGQKVKAGDPLLRLDTRGAALGAREAQANLAAAQAQRKLAEEECTRAKTLFDKGAITKSQFEREQTTCTAALQQVAAAEARTALIAKSVTDGIVRSPFSGEVAVRSVSPGEWVNPGKPLLTLLKVDALKVELSVPEGDIAKVAVGQTVSLVAVAFPDKIFAAKVTRLGGEISRTTRSLVAEAVIDPGSPLLPGMFVEVRLVTGTRPLPVVPEAALVRRGTSWRAFVVTGKRVEERLVQRGPEPAAGQASIIAGIKAGDKLVSPITASVVDGAAVE